MFILKYTLPRAQRKDKQKLLTERRKKRIEAGDLSGIKTIYR